MLSKYYGFVVINNSGQTLTFDSNGRLNLKITGIYIDPSTGKISYNALSDDDCGFIAGQNMADGASRHGVEIDNSANLYVTALVQLEITHDEGAAADGTFDIYYEGADTTGELPSDASGYSDPESNKLTFVGSLTWDPNGGDDEVMRSEVLAV